MKMVGLLSCLNLPAVGKSQIREITQMAQIVGYEPPHTIGCLNPPAASRLGLIRLEDGRIVLLSESQIRGITQMAQIVEL